MIELFIPELVDLLDDRIAHTTASNTSIPATGKYVPTIDEIPVSRVIYSGDVTTVYFTDGTKTNVKCSSIDKYDRQTAIAYALVKRFFGKLGRYDKKTNKFYANEIDGNGLGLKLEKIANAGYDQELEKQQLKEKKSTAKAEHEARQKAESDAAWRRKVQKRAEELRLEREANALLDSLAKTGKKPLNESMPDATPAEKRFSNDMPAAKKKDDWQNYKKPNKPFSKFTNEEKREYWRYHNAKRKASK